MLGHISASWLLLLPVLQQPLLQLTQHQAAARKQRHQQLQWQLPERWTHTGCHQREHALLRLLQLLVHQLLLQQQGLSPLLGRCYHP
jgi:hypothetical protein